MNSDSGHDQSNRIREMLKNLALLLCTCLFMLLLLEGAFRARAYLMDRSIYKKRDIMLDKFNRWDESMQTSKDAMGPMIRPISNGKIAFEMRPNLIGNYVGAEVRTSDMGFRDDTHSLVKPPGTIRIFGIGDSFMFGQGVEQEKTYMSVLERELNNRYKGKKWETINSGVPDYNTYIEVETLADKGLKLSPDVVLLGFCTNDDELPILVYYLGLEGEIEAEAYLRKDISFMEMYVRYRLDPSLPDRPLLKNKNRFRGGFGSITASLQRLYSLQQKHGFDVIILFITPRKSDVEKWFMSLTRALDFHIVDMEDDIRAYMEHNNISDYFDSEMVVPDKHPSEIVHKLTALRLVQYMEQSGIIKKLN